MTVAGLKRAALSSCVAAAMLAGCGGSQPPTGAPGAMPQRTNMTYRLLTASLIVRCSDSVAMTEETRSRA